MADNLTIIYYTENRLAEPLFTVCQRLLVKAANGMPIVSVSHKPIDLGKNICIGVREPSWLLLYQQLLKGVEAAETKYVGMAEHDCLYTNEHYSFRPPRDDTFYYNENHWLVQYADKKHPELKGMYSRYWKQRLALSQMICNRELLLQTLNERLALLSKDRDLVRKIVFAGEPGLSKLRLEEANRWAKSGRPVHLEKYLKAQLDKEKYDVFRTRISNLDIRHDRNFTGPKRGRHRRYWVKYWGRFEKIITRWQNKQQQEPQTELDEGKM